jgi:hypothetical protein
MKKQHIFNLGFIAFLTACGGDTPLVVTGIPSANNIEDILDSDPSVESLREIIDSDSDIGGHLVIRKTTNDECANVESTNEENEGELWTRPSGKSLTEIVDADVNGEGNRTQDENVDDEESSEEGADEDNKDEWGSGLWGQVAWQQTPTTGIIWNETIWRK